MIRTIILTASLVALTFGVAVEQGHHQYSKEDGKWFSKLPGPYITTANDFF